MSKDLESQLLDIGLVRTEAKVYLTLIRMGLSPAGEIAKKSKVHRSNVYDALVTLIGKGLVSYVYRGNRKYFEATDPERVFHIMKQRMVEFNELVPKLKYTKRLSDRENVAHMYEGLPGIRNVFSKIISDGDEVFILGLSEEGLEVLSSAFTVFNKRRRTAKIKAKILLDASLKNRVKGFDRDSYTSAKVFKNVNSDQNMTLITDKKVIFLILGSSPLGIEIDSAVLGKDYVKYFELLWKSTRN